MTQPQENHTNFDHLLDQALQSYSSTEPRLGLENRILAQIAAQPAARQLPGIFNRSLFWTGLAAICLAIAATVFLSERRMPEKKQEIARSVPSPNSKTHSYQIARPGGTPHIEQAAMRHHPRAAKSEYGPAQLTQQDRLLVEFVTLHHKDALNIAKQQQTPDSPIADAPLHVDPIVSNPIVIAPIAVESKDQASF